MGNICRKPSITPEPSITHCAVKYSRSLEWKDYFKPPFITIDHITFQKKYLSLLLLFLPEIPCTDLFNHNPVSQFQLSLLCPKEQLLSNSTQLYFPEDRVIALQAAIACAKAILHIQQPKTTRKLSRTILWTETQCASGIEHLFYCLKQLIHHTKSIITDPLHNITNYIHLKDTFINIKHSDTRNKLIHTHTLYFLKIINSCIFKISEKIPLTTLQQLTFPHGLECCKTRPPITHNITATLTPVQLLKHVLKAHTGPIKTYSASLDSAWSTCMRENLCLPPIPVKWKNTSSLYPAFVSIHTIMFTQTDTISELCRAKTLIIKLPTTPLTTRYDLFKFVFTLQKTREWLNYYGFCMAFFPPIWCYQVITDNLPKLDEISILWGTDLHPSQRQFFVTTTDNLDYAALLVDLHWRSS